MLCPTCPDVNLAMTDRQGVEIDYCPQCRGVWLDRGELDRIIQRAEQLSAAVTPATAPQSRDGYLHPSHERNPAYDRDRHKKRHKSLLGELFDF